VRRRARRTGAAMRSNEERSNEEKGDKGILTRSEEERSVEERSVDERCFTERSDEKRSDEERSDEERSDEEEERSNEERSDEERRSTTAVGCPLRRRPYRTAVARVGRPTMRLLDRQDLVGGTIAVGGGTIGGCNWQRLNLTLTGLHPHIHTHTHAHAHAHALTHAHAHTSRPPHAHICIGLLMTPGPRPACQASVCCCFLYANYRFLLMVDKSATPRVDTTHGYIELAMVPELALCTTYLRQKPVQMRLRQSL